MTLYEEKTVLGGNLASHVTTAASTHDVYPHMFSNFYVNFWDIVENDLGLRRDKSASSDFAYRESMKFLGLRHHRYMEIFETPDLCRTCWAICFRASRPPLDMYLWTYSMLDMLAHPFDAQTLMGEYSVSGFVQSRAYATERVIALHDFILMVIWSVHAGEHLGVFVPQLSAAELRQHLALALAAEGQSRNRSSSGRWKQKLA